MGFADQLRRWLRREGAEAREVLEDVRQRGEADLDRRERQLRETPEEGLARVRDEGRANDEAFDELRRKLGGSAPGPPGPSGG